MRFAFQFGEHPRSRIDPASVVANRYEKENSGITEGMREESNNVARRWVKPMRVLDGHDPGEIGGGLRKDLGDPREQAALAGERVVESSPTRGRTHTRLERGERLGSPRWNSGAGLEVVARNEAAHHLGDWPEREHAFTYIEATSLMQHSARLGDMVRELAHEP